MPKVAQTDIMAELNHLGQELVTSIRQQLQYLHVSAYKEEAQKEIKVQLENLRLVFSLFESMSAREPFADHDVESIQPMLIPGECSFTARTARLLAACDTWLESHRCDLNSSPSVEKDLSLVVHCGPILADLCSPGSNGNKFFRSL